MEKFNNIWKRFRYIIVAYVIVIILAILSLSFQTQLKKYFKEDFLTSFNASIVEDLIFFGVIGIIGVYITIKPYNEEDFNVRVKSLANNGVLKDDAIEYLKTEVKKLVAYTERSDITLTLKEIDETQKLVFIHTSIENKIKNMCKDIDFIFSDSTFYVKPNKSVRDDYGYVSFAGIQDETNLNNKVIYVENDVYRFKSNNEFYKPIKDFGIGKGSSALWKLAFGIWNEVKSKKQTEEIMWYGVKMNRYTARTNLTIINETPHEINAEVKYFPDEPERIEDIQIGGQGATRNILNNLSFYKNDWIKLKFRINE